MKVTVAVVDRDPDFGSRLGMATAEHFASAEDLEDRLPARTAAVVVFGPSYANQDGLRDIQDLLAGRPDLAAVLVAERISTTLLRDALRAGVRDVLVWPDDAAEISGAIERVGHGLSGLSPGPGSASEPGRLVAVFAGKGGSGKSTVATNLAVSLAMRPGRRVSDGPVALVDLDLQFGDDAVMLGLQPKHTIVDVVSAGHDPDVDVVRDAMCLHERSGLLVLPAPLDPSFADQVTAADVLAILAVLRATCSQVVVDMPAQFNDVVLSVLEESDDIMMVSSFDVPSIKNTKLGLQTMRLLNFPPEKITFVLNGVSSKVNLSVSDVERTLQVKAEICVPRDVLVPRAVNSGVPAVLDAPKSGVAKAFRDLADRVAVRPPPRKRG